MIDPEFESDLHSVIAAKVKDLEGIVHAINGTDDHIHIAVSVPPKISLSYFVGQVKGNSSHFVNHVIKPDFTFRWQNEYGVFSFSEKSLPYIVRYIKNQKVHHKEGTIIHRLERCT